MISGVGAAPSVLNTEAITEECENCTKVREEEFECLQKIEEEVIKIIINYDI